MASTDQLIGLAERIAEGLRGVSRNEWMRWVQVVEAHRGDVRRAIRFAQHTGNDPTMRPNVQRAHRAIAQVISGHQQQLGSLSSQDRQQVFGYVAWLLKIKETFSEDKRSSRR